MEERKRCWIETMVDGQDFPLPIQNMRMDTPLLGVQKYIKVRFSFHFCEDGCYMVSRHSNESDGAFWIKVKVKQPPDTEPPSAGLPSREIRKLQQQLVLSQDNP